VTKRRTQPNNEPLYRKKASDSAGGKAYRALREKVKAEAPK
jgi:hypothetical protein